jgi:6-phosphofructokinase
VRSTCIVDILVGAAVKRQAYDRSDGVAILAEGLLEKLLDPDDLASVEPRRARPARRAALRRGEPRRQLKGRVLKELRASGSRPPSWRRHRYELRCADPIPYDMEYTRDLGYCAARYLIEGGGGAMVSIQGGRFARPLRRPHRPRNGPHAGAHGRRPTPTATASRTRTWCG